MSTFLEPLKEKKKNIFMWWWCECSCRYENDEGDYRENVQTFGDCLDTMGQSRKLGQVGLPVKAIYMMQLKVALTSVRIVHGTDELQPSKTTAGPFFSLCGKWRCCRVVFFSFFPCESHLACTLPGTSCCCVDIWSGVGVAGLLLNLTPISLVFLNILWRIVVLTPVYQLPDL